MNVFALVDCNNFYASCERAFNPKLENQAIVVLSNNDGCVIARSNEAKKLGIPMGAPFFEWQSLCKKNKVRVFSSNYELYGDMSKRVMTLLAEECNHLEIYSIDEAFIDLSLIENKYAYGLQIREKIKACTGLPVSIGISTTKTLAKIANYLAKNHTTSGVFELTHDNMCILQEIPIEKIWGIGHQLSAKLKKLNIHTADDLKNADAKRLRSYFSVTLEKTIYELRSVSCIALETIQPRKQIISSRSFGKSINALSDLEEAISHFTAKAAVKLRNQHSLASGISVFLHTNFFKENEKQYENSTFFPFPIPTCDTGYMIRIAKKCLKHIYRQGYVYKKAGVILVDLIPNTLQQVDWLLSPSEKKIKLMQTLDIINQNYGKNTVFYGAEGILRPWQTKSIFRSPRYTTQWKELLKVKL